MSESFITDTPVLSKEMTLEGADGLYLLKVIDLGRSGEGIVVVAEGITTRNHVRYTLIISELELTRASITRHVSSLTDLLYSMHLVPSGPFLSLKSSIENIKDQKLGDEAAPTSEGSSLLQETLVTGLLELCRVKLTGDDAVQWLGEWLIENNPNNPNRVCMAGDTDLLAAT